MKIRCCKECNPPKRCLGCHENCKEYLEQKMEIDKERDYKNETKGYSDYIRDARSKAMHRKHTKNEKGD